MKMDTSESYGNEDLPKGGQITFTHTINGEVVSEATIVGERDLTAEVEAQFEAAVAADAEAERIALGEAAIAELEAKAQDDA